MRHHGGASSTGLLIGVVLALAILAAAVSAYLVAKQRRGSRPDFQPRYEQLTKVDPAELLYEKVRAFSTAMQDPRGLALTPSGQILVVGDQDLRCFEVDGKRAWNVALEAAPSCVACSGDGTIYVGYNQYVQVFKHDGTLRATWKAFDAKARLRGIAVAEARVFLADAGNRIVYGCDLDGTIRERIGAKDEARGVPGIVIYQAYFDLAVTADQKLWVINPGRHQLERYSFSGDLETSWGEYSPKAHGFCGCCNPVNLALLKDGGFVTAEKQTTRVKVYHANGSFRGVVAGPGDFKDAPHNIVDVAVAENQEVLVLDPASAAVCFYALKGKEDEGRTRDRE